jgi:hypothetical protein
VVIPEADLEILLKAARDNLEDLADARAVARILKSQLRRSDR